MCLLREQVWQGQTKIHLTQLNHKWNSRCMFRSGSARELKARLRVRVGLRYTNSNWEPTLNIKIFYNQCVRNAYIEIRADAPTWINPTQTWLAPRWDIGVKSSGILTCNSGQLGSGTLPNIRSELLYSCYFLEVIWLTLCDHHCTLSKGCLKDSTWHIQFLIAR